MFSWLKKVIRALTGARAREVVEDARKAAEAAERAQHAARALDSIVRQMPPRKPPPSSRYD